MINISRDLEEQGSEAGSDIGLLHRLLCDKMGRQVWKSRYFHNYRNHLAIPLQVRLASFIRATIK